MPIDSRRNQGPETSAPYSQYSDSSSKNSNSLVNKDAREDGRSCADHRKIFVKTGIISQAKGSAYIELKNTKVLCTVFDPREIPNLTEYSQHGELYCTFKYAPFSCHQRRSHQQDSEEKELSLILKHALEPAVCRHEFPNFQVDINALVLENDGSALAAAITCAGLALADAHIPMYDLVSAATIGIHGEHQLVDPTTKEKSIIESTEIEGDHGTVMMCVMGSQLQITQVWQTGSMSVTSIYGAMEKLTKTCEVIHSLVQRCLVQSVADTVSKKDNST